MKLQVSEEELRTYHLRIDMGEYFFIEFSEFVNIVARKMLETDIED